ncbi:3-deoxy-manno-octulosonate cytidylyltransferase [Sneathiella sp. HT1-7]|jgi:3-deoxy-manno-octulosonate cytidylyltransferase (CMP-KDO synthetase)|uniref:3-deoxy-manno-octulosonate cytidylyltransferase n=1 Tax=Sneathiella sp. HT1-7 TaxID=2887192 RepID=UPI001D13FDF2|nr:3-deoxy-manno-octulosonate cytidylyltransferase [Sneathiella sp. HT1-7]MCC3303566.1 3-deoxy-manno-octulosonate cytidylyltransferase [Sneathiella sp. HT1-7]
MDSLPKNPLIVIPARMASSRLPGKPLADIDGMPMIVQVMRRAEEADIGPVLVACAEEEIAEAIRTAGGTALMTRADHPSGSDRVFEAVEAFDPDGAYDAIINLQGDLPALEPSAIAAVFQPLQNVAVDIATLVAEIKDEEELEDENAVKAVVSLAEGESVGRALWFSRLKSPWGSGPHYHHIGLYAYRRGALARFVTLSPAPLEQRERLEQLRALENGMRIDAAVVDTVPLGVDTPEDLARIRRMFRS